MTAIELLLFIFLFTLLGVFAGSLTGLVPGIHINLLAFSVLAIQTIFVSAVLSFLPFNPTIEQALLVVSAFIIGMLVAHTFVEFIPSIFLGVPTEATALSVLPGHRLVLERKGAVAVRCAAVGSLGAIFLALILLFPVRLLVGNPISAYEKLHPYIPHILVLIVLILVLSEYSYSRAERTYRAFLLSVLKPRFLAFCIFLLAGIFGLIVLSPQLLTYNIYLFPVAIQEPLFLPLFTGLFGLPTLMLSLQATAKIPPQHIKKLHTGLTIRQKLKSVVAGTVAGGLVAFYPGVTAAQGTVLAKLLYGKNEEEKRDKELKSQREFLVAVAGADMANAVFSVVALFVLLKARSGVMVAVSTLNSGLIVPWMQLSDVPLMLAVFIFVILIAGLLSFQLTILLGNIFAVTSSKLPYRKLVLSVMIFLVLLVTVLSGIIGLVVLFLALCIGLLPPLLGVSRVHLMGCLLLPIILFYLGVS